MTPTLVLVAWLLAGIVAGAVYYRTIWWSARRFADGGSLAATIALSLLRLAVLGTLLAMASFQGAAPLLAMALGVVLARFGMVKRLRAVVA